MGRHRKQLTQEQIDFRRSILRGRVSSVKKAEDPVKMPLTEDEKIQQCFYFLNNCVYWVNEYIEGRTDKKELLRAAEGIIHTGKNLQSLLTPKTP